MDRKSSLFDFKFQEDRYNEFDAGSPPAVRAILQVKTCLVACLAFNEGPSTIQVWDLLTKEEVASVEHAHSLEVTAMVNYYPVSTSSYQQSSSTSGGDNNSPLESDLFVTGGNDKSLKLWQLAIGDKIVRLLYVVRLDEPIVCMVVYSMDQYRGCVVPFVDT